MGTSCHRCFTRLDPPHFQGVKMANSGSQLRSILETRSRALHFAERNTAWCLPHPWRRYGRDCRWNKGDCRFNYPMRTANSLRPRQSGEGIWVAPQPRNRWDDIHQLASSAAFVACAQVNLFNTTRCLPPEGGQQSVTPFVEGGGAVG